MSTTNKKGFQLEAAIQALVEAVTATRAYLAEIRDHPEKQSDLKQGEIAQKWMQAGTKIYPIDGRLADDYARRRILLVTAPSAGHELVDNDDQIPPKTGELI